MSDVRLNDDFRERVDEATAPPQGTQFPQRVLDRLWDNVSVGGPDECWPWATKNIARGYGRMKWWQDGAEQAGSAHRAAWTAHHGRPIPGRLTVDHLCHNRLCCNPRHLRLLTLAENSALTSRRQGDRCCNGHIYEPGTFRVKNGTRICRLCHREYTARRSGQAERMAARRCEVCGVSLAHRQRVTALTCGEDCKKELRRIRAAGRRVLRHVE